MTNQQSQKIKKDPPLALRQPITTPVSPSPVFDSMSSFGCSSHPTLHSLIGAKKNKRMTKKVTRLIFNTTQLGFKLLIALIPTFGLFIVVCVPFVVCLSLNQISMLFSSRPGGGTAKWCVPNLRPTALMKRASGH